MWKLLVHIFLNQILCSYRKVKAFLINFLLSSSTFLIIQDQLCILHELQNRTRELSNMVQDLYSAKHSLALQYTLCYNLNSKRSLTNLHPSFFSIQSALYRHQVDPFHSIHPLCTCAIFKHYLQNAYLFHHSPLKRPKE